MFPPRRILAIASFACALATVVHGCAAGNSSTNAFTGTDSGTGDGTASSSSGGSSGSSSGFTGSSSGAGSSSGSSSGGVSDASQDSPGLADAMSCVHNDDCMGANICTSGYACLGGLCVPTGKPQNCDDGVPCTDDSCSAQTNKCVHTPNDSNCPNSEYCDPVKNCVQTLPCTPGSSVCDRLNTDVCDGLYTCDSTKMYCVQGAAPCAQMVPNAATMCTAGSGADGGMQATCSWTCNSGYVHIVWTNGVPSQVTSFGPPPPTAGCECQQTSATDNPDYTGQDSGFVDSNCDGIDGTVANAIFVDGITGNDSNAGTIDKPKRTIQAGIVAASTANPTKDVYVSKGSYDEHVDMEDGVSLYGGYDAANDWQRHTSNITTIASTNTVGVSAQGLTHAFTIQFVTASTQAATPGSGLGAYGIRLVSNSAAGLVQGCTVESANAGSGIVPKPAVTGATGGNASGQILGGSSCGSTGGEGGPAVSGATTGVQGGPGNGPGGGPGGSPGGSGNGCCVPGNGGPGGPGTPGGSGSNGSDSSTTAASVGPVLSDGSYQPANGGGGVAGTNGGGGGGGGSGGGAGDGCPLNCHDDTSGYGGGGGGGGCGGTGGGPGGGGGASFGIVITATQATVDQCQVNAGKGGDGAAGGAGASGGGGGGAANGVGGGGSAGAGGAGGNGGSGGHGGAGSGGTGGPSVCVAYTGTVPAYTNSHCNRAGGGVAGQTGGGLAPAGLPGIDAELRGF